MELDHIIPASLGGETIEDNLWQACSACNDRKNDRISARDPETGKQVRLFDPRRQIWAEHFEWVEGASVIAGRTATGRVTVHALQLNRPVLVAARQAWVEVGWHPPTD
jgi:hypothetical protein